MFFSFNLIVCSVLMATVSYFSILGIRSSFSSKDSLRDSSFFDGFTRGYFSSDFFSSEYEESLDYNVYLFDSDSSLLSSWGLTGDLISICSWFSISSLFIGVSSYSSSLNESISLFRTGRTSFLEFYEDCDSILETFSSLFFF